MHLTMVALMALFAQRFSDSLKIHIPKGNFTHFVSGMICETDAGCIGITAWPWGGMDIVDGDFQIIARVRTDGSIEGDTVRALRILADKWRRTYPVPFDLP